MDPTQSIARLGFRKWYERELIKSHAALVTCFLCGILVAALLEQVNLRALGWGNASALLVVLAAALVGWASWRSYITLLNRAERYGERSTCPNCAMYGRFKVLETGTDTVPSEGALAVAPLAFAWMKVECRKCGTGWRMPE
jgi:hypothetical protein